MSAARKRPRRAKGPASPPAETLLEQAREVRADDPSAREAWRTVEALSPKLRRRPRAFS